MNVDRIIGGFNEHGVRYLLIGGMNFLLRHKPVLTFDVDLWIEDTDENLRRCEAALSELDAAWGVGESDWGPVKDKPSGWLRRQAVFCMTSPYGAIDVFRSVRGLAGWAESHAESVECVMASGMSCRGLSDGDMLKCQLSLDEADRKQDRIRELRKAMDGHG
jgi:hypothetical protein